MKPQTHTAYEIKSIHTNVGLHRRERVNGIPALPLSLLPLRKRCESAERSKGNGASARKRRMLLVPVDFTESSLKALDYALSHAKRINATVTLLHVLEGVYGEAFLDSPVRIKERTRAIASGSHGDCYRLCKEAGRGCTRKRLLLGKTASRDGWFAAAIAVWQ
jgi:hypothetical protein